MTSLAWRLRAPALLLVLVAIAAGAGADTATEARLAVLRSLLPGSREPRVAPATTSCPTPTSGASSEARTTADASPDVSSGPAPSISAPSRRWRVAERGTSSARVVRYDAPRTRRSTGDSARRSGRYFTVSSSARSDPPSVEIEPDPPRGVEPAAAPERAEASPEPLRCDPDAWWRRSSAATRQRTRSAIRDASRRYGIASKLIRSVIRHESAFSIDAVSDAGAMGLMQLMPETARMLGVSCAFDPRQNVLAGTRYLRRLYDRFQSWPHALAAYNAGPTRVDRGEVPAETHVYVERVMKSWRPIRSARLALK